MSITIRFHAGLKEAAGVAEMSVQGSTVAELRIAIARTCPTIEEQLAYCRFAIDDEFVDEKHDVADGAIVHVIPPVSGG